MLAENTTYVRLRKMSFIVLTCCLAAVFFTGFDTILAKSRDIKRRADIEVLVKALELYHDEYSYYPDSISDWQGWDLTYEYGGEKKGFLEILKKRGILSKFVSDPINDVNYYYRYQKYPAGSYDCDKPFYILQIINFELPSKDIGQGECPSLDWAELATNGYTVQKFD